VDDRATLDDFIARLRASRNVATDVAREAVSTVGDAIRRTAAAGADADGKAWAPRKDGGRALPNASARVVVTSAGPTLTASVPYPYQFHQRGDAHNPKRAILPESSAALPASIRAALRDASERVWRRMMGGARG
jgi:hypothetical protein